MAEGADDRSSAGRGAFRRLARSRREVRPSRCRAKDGHPTEAERHAAASDGRHRRGHLAVRGPAPAGQCETRLVHRSTASPLPFADRGRAHLLALAAAVRAGLGERLGGERRRTPAPSARPARGPAAPALRARASGARTRTGSSTRSRPTPAGAPLAWIDDAFNEACEAWAAARAAPTLLVQTEPAARPHGRRGAQAARAWAQARCRARGPATRRPRRDRARPRGTAPAASARRRPRAVGDQRGAFGVPVEHVRERAARRRVRRGALTLRACSSTSRVRRAAGHRAGEAPASSRRARRATSRRLASRAARTRASATAASGKARCTRVAQRRQLAVEHVAGTFGRRRRRGGRRSAAASRREPGANAL